MHQYGTWIKFQKQVFAAAQASAQDMTLNQVGQVSRDWPAHAWLVNYHLFQGLTCCNGVNSTAGCFNFWEFWHG
jgi:hypothetical protein